MNFGFVVDGCGGCGTATVQPTDRKNEDRKRFHRAPIVLQLSGGNVRVMSFVPARRRIPCTAPRCRNRNVSGNIVVLYDKDNLSAKLLGGLGVVGLPSCAAGSTAASVGRDTGSVAH